MYELLYTSVARHEMSDGELADILNVARLKNAKLAITGMLVYKDLEFVQILEGEEAVVKELFAVIEQDRRHTSVTVFYEGPVESRAFTGWSMAFHVMDELSKSMFVAGHAPFDPRDSIHQFVRTTPNTGKELFLSLRRQL